MTAAAGVPVLHLAGIYNNHSTRTTEKINSVFNTSSSFNTRELKILLQKTGGVIAETPDKTACPENHKSSSLLSIPDLISRIKKVIPIAGAVFDIKVDQGSVPGIKETKNILLFLKKQLLKLNIKSTFFLTSMNQLPGYSVGNSLEVLEAIKVLEGDGPLDVLKLSLEISSEILFSAGIFHNRMESKKYLRQQIETGNALDKLKEIIKAQGGNPEIVEDLSLLPMADTSLKINSKSNGFVHEIRMNLLSLAWKKLVAYQSGIEPGEGFLIHKKEGDKVRKGEVLLEIFHQEIPLHSEIQEAFRKAFVISKKLPSLSPLIIEKISD